MRIREVQHYVYCAHRWGLIHIGCDWSENLFVNRAVLMHENADSGKNNMVRGKYVERSVRVFNREWDLYGILDCLQLTPDASGYYIPKYGKKFSLDIIEYKPTHTVSAQAALADRMQLLAQKICVDSMFSTDSKTSIYYADIRKRVYLSFEEKDFVMLKSVISQIKDLYDSAEIPPARQSQLCGGCSMKDICLPKIGSLYEKIT